MYPCSFFQMRPPLLSCPRPTGKIDSGDVDAVFASRPPHLAEGTLRLGGQEHFYLETNACCVIPLENDEFLIYSSTQVSAGERRVPALLIHAGKRWRTTSSCSTHPRR